MLKPVSVMHLAQRGELPLRQPKKYIERRSAFWLVSSECLDRYARRVGKLQSDPFGDSLFARDGAGLSQDAPFDPRCLRHRFLYGANTMSAGSPGRATALTSPVASFTISRPDRVATHASEPSGEMTTGDGLVPTAMLPT
jgi:hypothetical protein